MAGDVKSKAAPQRRKEDQRTERAVVQGAELRNTPVGGRDTATTPAAPDNAAIERAAQAKQAKAQRTGFKAGELQQRREGDKDPTFDKGPQAERKVSPFAKAAEKLNTAEAKSERSAQPSFDRARQRDNFER